VYRLGYLDEAGKRCDAVVRCHGDIDYANNSHIAADEFAFVSALRETLQTVPRPLYLGADKAVMARPYAIYEFVEGELVSDTASLGSRIPQMAQWLANLHELDAGEFKLRVSSSSVLVPRQALRDSSSPLDEEVFEPQIRGLLEQFSQPLISGKPVLLHGDYWSGNLLWQDKDLVAVIDWEDFGVGDAFADLGCARLELLWATNESFVERFTDSYLRARGLALVDVARALAYWDLCSVLPFANTLQAISLNDADRSSKRKALAGFVGRAANALDGSFELGA